MQRPGRRGWICGGFCGALWCGAGADVVRRGGGGGGGVMWGWLVRMTKEMGRGWQWPSPEATRCLSLHPPGACVDVVCTAAMCVVTQQLRVSLQLREDGGGSAACCLVEARGRGERERACLFGMVLCRAHNKKRKRQMQIGASKRTWQFASQILLQDLVLFPVIFWASFLALADTC